MGFDMSIHNMIAISGRACAAHTYIHDENMWPLLVAIFFNFDHVHSVENMDQKVYINITHTQSY